MHVDAGQVRGPVSDGSVDVVGGRGGRPRPRGLVPAVRPEQTIRVGAGMFGDQLQAVLERRRSAQIQPGQREAGTHDVNMAVDERGCDERSVQIDDLGVRKLSAADVVAAQPRDDAVADRHRGRIGMGRAVHPPAYKKGRHRGEATTASAGAPEVRRRRR